MSNKLSIYCKIYVKVYPDAAQHYAENLKLHDLRYPKSIVTFFVCNKQEISGQLVSSRCCQQPVQPYPKMFLYPYADTYSTPVS